MQIKAVKMPYIPGWYGVPFLLLAIEIRQVPGQMVFRTRFRLLMPCRWMLTIPSQN